MFGPSPHGISPGHTPSDINANYGFFHVYAFTMTLGMILAIFASYYQLRKRKVPIEPLILSIIFIIPAALLGGSFFGKVNRDPSAAWYTNFYFWHSGMSIHGGVLFGLVVGLIYFYIVGRKSHISLWVYADAIVPNILLGQIVGRWGNFFNHELLGQKIAYDHLLWLPAFIRDNLWQWDPNGNMPETFGGHIVFREPVFLYESFGDFCAWVFIIFVLPHLGRWKAKLQAKKTQKMTLWKRPLFYRQKYPEINFVSYKEMWNDYYYNYQPAVAEVYQCDQIINSHRKDSINKHIGWWRFWRQKYRYRKKLSQLHNRENKFIIKSGVAFGVYFFLWNFIRYWIETRRNDINLFIYENRPLDTALLWTFVAIGLIIALLAQFVIPNLTRKNGWQYEKIYQKTWLLSSWPFGFFDKIPRKLINYQTASKHFDLDQAVNYLVNDLYVHKKDKIADYKIETKIIPNTLKHKIKIIAPPLPKQVLFSGTYSGVFDFKIDLAALNWSKIISVDHGDLKLTNKKSLSKNEKNNLALKAVSSSKTISFMWQKYRQLRQKKVSKYYWKDFCNLTVLSNELKLYLNQNYQKEVAQLLFNLIDFDQEFFDHLRIFKLGRYFYFRAKCLPNGNRYNFTKKFLILELQS